MTTQYTFQQVNRDSEVQQQQKLAKKIKNFIYDPADVVGSGFSSKVYKGINQQNNQQVAIKVIELSKIQNQVEKYLLNNQINALRALKHKNILRTIDILMTKNNVYIVTEFCQFGDLQQMIKNNKKVNQKDALNIAKDIIEGYIAIEEKNIIHRDLKTANIFITKNGAKIADFGFCQFVGQKKPQIAYNVGSPAYMSPQSYKQNYYSHKSDIWGIGIIFYQMLIGETPQKNSTYTQMSNNLMNGKINCGSNEEIKKILISCFKKDLKQRIDAKDLLLLINNALDIINRNFVKDQRNSRFNNIDTKIYPQIQNINYKDVYDLSNQDKQFVLTQSPSHMQQIKKIDQNPYRHTSMTNPSNIQNGNDKKQNFLSSSGVVNNFRNADINQSSKQLKSQITMLQFIFRLFKHVSQISIPSLPFLRLLLFRHRSHIDQMSESILQSYRIDAKNSQLHKQFQYLKTKFDESYLDKESNSPKNQNHEFMQTMNRLANISFVDHQSIKSYKEIIRKSCEQVQAQISQNRSNAFVLWDYLLIQFQLLSLYDEGQKDHTIVTQKCFLELILKQKPNTINKNHIELLKIKTQHLFDTQSSQKKQTFIKF